MFALALPLSRKVCLSAAVLLALRLPQLAFSQDYGQQAYPPQPGAQQPGYGQPNGDPSQIDPPSRVARISVLQGNVSLQPAGVEDFSPAGLNYPLTSGDRLYSDVGAITELEAGQLAVRLDGATDLSVTSMTDQLAQFGLGQGSIHVRSYDLDPNSTLEIDTPNVAVTVLAPGDIRVDVSQDGTMTRVTLLSGQARVDGPGFQQQLQPGESMQLTGSQPVKAQDVRRPRGDSLDSFSSDRDRTYQNAIAMEGDYVNPGTIGAADLGQYGDWSNEGDTGPVWYPRGVSVDWQPYSFGHWAYIAPWGWTWVENEPWGFAPFHYGRWARFGPRWGWIPGPHVVRPVYSPALVAFVGGGVGVTAWFPLGPREPYVPWYRTSPLYANRINVSNIYNRNAVEVRSIYNQRSTNIYINNSVNNRVFVNRQVATVAVPQNAFAGGRPVHEVSMRVSPQQFANAPILNRPNAMPTRAIMAPAPARVLPPRLNRPPVETRAPTNNAGGPRPGGWNRPDRVPATNPGGFNNGTNQPSTAGRPGQYGNQPGNTNTVQPGFGNGRRDGFGSRPTDPNTPMPSGGARPTNVFGNQPGGSNTRENPDRGRDTQVTAGQPAQQQSQPPAPSASGDRFNPPAQSTQPQGSEGRQYPPRTYDPNQRPGQPSTLGQGTNAPGAIAPSGPSQYPGHRNGREPNPPTQQPTQPIQPSQAQPGPHVPLSAPAADRNQTPRDFRGQPNSGASPMNQERPQSQAPAGNIHQWQQPGQQPAQNRVQPPAQAPREMPMRVGPQPAQQSAPVPQPQRPPPQPMIAPRQPMPPPNARPAPPTPHENHGPPTDKKQ